MIIPYFCQRLSCICFVLLILINTTVLSAVIRRPAPHGNCYHENTLYKKLIEDEEVNAEPHADGDRMEEEYKPNTAMTSTCSASGYSSVWLIFFLHSISISMRFSIYFFVFY